MQEIDAALQAWDEKPYTGYANMGYVQSWFTTLFLREVIGNVLERGEEPTGDNLIEEANVITGFDTGGIIKQPVELDEQRVPYAILYRFNVSGDTLDLEEATDFVRIGDDG